MQAVQCEYSSAYTSILPSYPPKKSHSLHNLHSCVIWKEKVQFGINSLQISENYL